MTQQNGSNAMVPAGPALGQMAISGGFDAQQQAGLNSRYELLMRLAAKAPERDPERLIKLAEAIGTRLGEDGFYYWEVLNKRTGKMDPVEGSSIDLVEALREVWGFTAVEVRITSIIGDLVILDAECFDGKNGNLTARPYPVAVPDPPGNFAKSIEQSNRWRAQQVGSAVSKATRVVLEHALPAWFVLPGFRAAKAAYEKGLPTGEKLEERIKITVGGFARQHGATVEELAEYLQIPRSAWDGKCCLRLDSLWIAIDKGNVSATEVFGPIREVIAEKKKAPNPPPEGTTGPEKATPEPPATQPPLIPERPKRKPAAAPAAEVATKPAPPLALEAPKVSAAEELGLPTWDGLQRLELELASVTDRNGVDDVVRNFKAATSTEHYPAIEGLRKKYLAKYAD